MYTVYLKRSNHRRAPWLSGSKNIIDKSYWKCPKITICENCQVLVAYLGVLNVFDSMTPSREICVTREILCAYFMDYSRRLEATNFNERRCAWGYVRIHLYVRMWIRVCVGVYVVVYEYVWLWVWVCECVCRRGVNLFVCMCVGGWECECECVCV